MRTDANHALHISRRNAASPQRLPRHLFRTMLRMADTIGPINRAIFARR